MTKNPISRGKTSRTITRPDPTNVLYQLRHINGLTIGQLEQMSGVPARFISQAERGNYTAPPECYQKLASVLGVTPEDILHGTASVVLKGYAPAHHRPSRKRSAAHMDDRTKLGAQGEQFVLEQERKRLAGTPYAAFVSDMPGNRRHEGYDLRSFQEDGTVLSIEVKTTSRGLNASFQMTAAERKTMERLRKEGACYQIHRVYCDQDGNMECRMIAGDDLDHLVFEPSAHVGIIMK